MGSKVDVLIRSFLRADADALHVVPGERIFLMKGSARAVVGREPVSAESFEAVAGELVPGESGSALAERRHRVSLQVDPTAAAVDVQFGLVSGRPSLMVSRLASAEALDPARVSPEASSGGFQRAEAAVAAAGEESPAGGIPRLAALAWAAEPAAEQARPALRLPPAPAAPAPGKVPARLSLEDLLLRMLDLDAFEVHLASGARPAYRIAGEIAFQDDMPLLASSDVERLLSGVLPPRARAELPQRPDIDFSFELEGAARFVVNVYRDRNGLAAAVRQAPFRIRTAEELFLPASVAGMADLPSGLVLVTGPQGSGKTMTIASLVDAVNRTRALHVVTLEDPIEFVHANVRSLVNQREVGAHAKGFLEGIRAAGREDPDVIVVSDLSDPETFLAALSAADAGRLVLGALPTPSAAATVERALEPFTGERQSLVRLMLADSLRGVVSQALCRRIGGGVVPAYEVLVGTATVRNLLREGKAYQVSSVLASSRAHGMQTLNESLLDLVAHGVVEPREAFLKAHDRQGLVAGLRSLGVPLPTEAGLEPATASQARPGAAPRG